MRNRMHRESRLRRTRAVKVRRAATVLAIVLIGAACGSSSKSGGATTTTSGSTATTGGSSTTAAVAATTTTAPADKTNPNGVIKVGMAKGDIDSIDPNRWYAAITWGLANGLCTTLLRYDDKAGNAGVNVVAGLSDMPTVSSDGTEYTFKLRAAKFANGDPITPADVKYTFERMAHPDIATGSDGYMSIVGKDDYTAKKATEISGITTTADSVIFKLTAADGSFPYKVSLPTTCPVQKGAEL
jgi:ABC-type transport system substrate-binding protein